MGYFLAMDCMPSSRRCTGCRNFACRSGSSLGLPNQPRASHSLHMTGEIILFPMVLTAEETMCAHVLQLQSTPLEPQSPVASHGAQ